MSVKIILREYPLKVNKGYSLKAYFYIEVTFMYERIRNMREDKDLTQAQMAAYLNIHQTTYSDYEIGNLNIPVAVLSQIADLFETSIDYLVDRTDEQKPYLRKR
jgi:transcriptional regulator with XRE-family HTH domain